MAKSISCLLLTMVFFFGSVLAVPTLDQFHVVTVASDKTKGLQQLLHSCEFNNVPIEVLGLGQPYKGNGQKLTLIQKYLEAIPDEDVVMFVDGYDTLILATKEKILQAFLNKGATCIFSAERGCYPHAHLAKTFPESPTKFRYLNSGSFISYAAPLKKLLKNLEPINESSCDQGPVTLYYLAHQDEIVLDNQCEFFLALFKVKKRELLLSKERKTVFCHATQTTPFVIHGNGPSSKPVYQEIYDRLFKKN